jgi:hypothetical protein
MTNHQRNRGLGDDVLATITRSRNIAIPDQTEDAAAMTSAIATGRITRERCCDGKVRFVEFAHASKVAALKGDQHGHEQYAYACPFCGGFHLATTKGVVTP